MTYFRFRFSLVALAAPFLATACLGVGSNAPPEQIVAPAVARTGNAALYAFTYQPTSGSPDRVVRTTSGAGWFYYPDTLAGVPTKFKVFRQSTEGFLLRATTDSGTGEVIVVDNGAQLTRTDPSTLPTVGNASYTGTYAAIVVDGVRDMTPDTVSGKANLQVSFRDQRVVGSITDRVYNGTTASQDVTLDMSTMSDGSFTGTTSGGDLGTGGLVAAPGTYTGMLVGPNGEEAIGTLTITHSGGGTFTEQGGFVASQ